MLKKPAPGVAFQFFSQHLHLSPIGTADSADGSQGGGFPAAVGAHNGIEAPLILLGYTPMKRFEDVINCGLIQTVYSLEEAKVLSETAVRLGKKALVHIKLDTGMGRLGWRINEKSSDEIIDVSSLVNEIL